MSPSLNKSIKLIRLPRWCSFIGYSPRPEEVSISSDGIPIELETTQFLDTQKKLGHGHVKGHKQQKISVILPVDIEGEVSVLPGYPYLFPVTA